MPHAEIQSDRLSSTPSVGCAPGCGELDVFIEVAMVVTRKRKVFPMIRWNARAMRISVAIASLVSLAIASGAGARWS
jgi:hypothetical protein